MNAFTVAGHGNETPPLEITTEVKGPSAPIIVNLTCSLDSLYIQWEKPVNYYKSVDHYLVYYRSENSRDFNHISLPNQLQVCIRISNYLHLKGLILILFLLLFSVPNKQSYIEYVI